MTIGALTSPRPALAVGFLASLSWVALSAQGLLDAVPLPSEIKLLIGVCTPVLVVSALLYRTALFTDIRHARRVVSVVGVAIALLVAAFNLLLLLSVVLFAFTGIP